MSITSTLNRFQRISEKFIDNENLTKKDLEFIENNIDVSIRELEIELNWLYDFKNNVSKDYVLKLKD